MMSIRIILSTILWLTCVPALAQSSESLATTERLLEDRVNSVVRLYDPQSFSIVEVVAAKEKTQLPGIPFYYDDYTIRNSDGLDIQRLTVTILSRLTSLPVETNTLVVDLLKKYSPQVDVKFKQVMPADSAMKSSIAEVRVHFPEDGAWVSSVFKSPWVLAGGALGLVLAAAAVASLILLSSGMRSGMQSVSSGISQGLGEVKESLQSGGLGSGSAASQAVTQATITAVSGGSSSWSQLSNESCLAILSDCYWSEKDAYANFVWGQLNVAQRMAVTAAWPALEKYVRHTASVSAQDLGLHLDVNYLSPLPFHQLNNASLTDQVKKFPAILRRLSPLRSEGLSLGVKERLMLQGKAQKETQFPDWNKLSASTERALQPYAQVRLDSEAREKEVLDLKSLPLEAKEQFISLAWMAQLPREQVAEVLDGFSAKELAQAWVGPDSLLNFLSECLAPKKRELVDSYRTSIRASRNSDVYLMLHRATMAVFRRNHQAAPGDSSNAKAA